MRLRRVIVTMVAQPPLTHDAVVAAARAGIRDSDGCSAPAPGGRSP